MRAHLVQYDIAWENPQANYAVVRALLADASVAQGDLVLLPEMFDTGFSLNVETTADRSGASAAFLASLARSLNAFVVGGVTAIGSDGGGRNRALCFSPVGEEVARYDKVHPFSFGREPERFTGGDRVVVFPWSVTGAANPDAPATALMVCPVICYDLRFPELFRAGLTLGAECYVVMANWPEARAQHWRALAIARAIENQAFVLAVNRTGAYPHLAYAGGSIAVGPDGAILAEAAAVPSVVSVALDATALRGWRASFPAWRDWRVGLMPTINHEGGFDTSPASTSS